MLVAMNLIHPVVVGRVGPCDQCDWELGIGYSWMTGDLQQTLCMGVVGMLGEWRKKKECVCSVEAEKKKKKNSKVTSVWGWFKYRPYFLCTKTKVGLRFIAISNDRYFAHPFCLLRASTFAGQQLIKYLTARKAGEGYGMLENLLLYKDMVAFLCTQAIKSSWV